MEKVSQSIMIFSTPMIDGFLQEFRGRVLNKSEPNQNSKPRAKNRYGEKKSSQLKKNRYNIKNSQFLTKFHKDRVKIADFLLKRELFSAGNFYLHHACFNLNISLSIFEMYTFHILQLLTVKKFEKI